MAAGEGQGFLGVWFLLGWPCYWPCYSGHAHLGSIDSGLRDLYEKKEEKEWRWVGETEIWEELEFGVDIDQNIVHMKFSKIT